MRDITHNMNGNYGQFWPMAITTTSQAIAQPPFHWSPKQYPKVMRSCPVGQGLDEVGAYTYQR